MRVPSLHGLVFIQLFLRLVPVVFLGMLREKRGGRGGQGEDAWFAKYESIEICCSQRTKIHLNSKLPSGIVNPNNLILYLQGLEAQVKPHKLKFKPHGFYANSIDP